METRLVTAAFVALSLIYYAERCSGVVQIIIPDSGSVIEGFVGDGNFSFFCEVLLPNGDEQATTWSIQQQGDSSPRTLLRDNDLNIIFTGDPIPEAPQFTFNTNLTITALTIELHESTLFCGTQGNLEAANFTILVFQLPTPPLALAVNDSDEDSVIITWQPPVTIGSPPTSVYRLALSPVDNPQAQNVSINVSVPTTAVDVDAPDLFPQTMYLATITAVSEMFESPPSLPINFNTSTSVPRLECNSVPTPQDSTLILSPSLVHTGGLDLVNHTVEVRRMESENFTTVNQEIDFAIVNSQITDAVVDNNFEAGSTYIFRVSSSNSLGFSDPVECPPINLTIGIPTVPSTPTGESTDPNTVRLTLSTAEAGVPDPPHSFRFNVQVFQLFPNDSSEIATLIGNFTQEYPEYVDGSSVMFDASGLIADEQFVNGSTVMYVADARAINDVGASDFSNLSEPITVELTVPVLGEVQIQITATQIIVQWEFVHTGGVAVTEVLVEFRAGSSQVYEVAPGGNLTDSEASETMLRISALEFLAGVDYQFRVTATNVIGLSPQSESDTISAPIGVPGTPDVPIVVSFSGGRAILDLRTSAPGVLDPPHSFRFVVRVYPLSTNDSFDVTMGFPSYMSGEREQFEVEDLVIDEQYQFAVQANSQFGSSEFSGRSAIVTITEGDDGLSAGALAGIVVGVIVGVLLLVVVIVLIILCCIKIKKEKESNKMESSEELGLQYNTAYEKEKPSEETAFSATDQPEPETTNTYEAIAEKEHQREQQEAEQQESAPALYDTLAAVNGQMTTNLTDPDIDEPQQAKTSDNPLYSGVGGSTDALVDSKKDDPVYQEAP